MAKTPFTIRLDNEVRAVAERLAAAERRSVTSLIEVAVLEYAEKRGFKPEPEPEKAP
jgi:predicted transcriptional regulator